MEAEHNNRLTSAEIAHLWISYTNDTMAVCILKYFAQKVEDSEIKPVIDYALSVAQKHIQTVKKIMESENAAVPQGFTDEDVNPNCPRLYSDTFFLQYLKQMSRAGLKANSLGLSLAARDDVIRFYNMALTDSAELCNKATGMLLSKGLYIRAPYIPVPQKVDFVRKMSFLSNLLKEKDRPLTAIEIANIYGNMQTNGMGSALLTGFSQVARSAEVRQYLAKGIELANKEMEILHRFLAENRLPAPMTWDGDVTASTEPPFSDKLMLFHVCGLNTIGIGDIGDSLGTSMRADLSASYARFLADVLSYAEDGANIMIANGWLEQPPQAADREALAGV
ncbi:DUF3231 family protein [Paenibacillus hamazuiensis]|uniref:DUF3231 family protein n=1 Tax=Paenibacillus hamazuiensis TaxID=2936508 RepID=UPI00200C3AF3|nr:DUF3231 family protein [Paenibacillus hamazuiensis]